MSNRASPVRSRRRVELLEEKRLEAERLEAARLEAARIQAPRLEAQLLEAERLEAERLGRRNLRRRLEAELLKLERGTQESHLAGEWLEKMRIAESPNCRPKTVIEESVPARARATRTVAFRVPAAGVRGSVRLPY